MSPFRSLPSNPQNDRVGWGFVCLRDGWSLDESVIAEEGTKKGGWGWRGCSKVRDCKSMSLKWREGNYPQGKSRMEIKHRKGKKKREDEEGKGEEGLRWSVFCVLIQWKQPGSKLCKLRESSALHVWAGTSDSSFFFSVWYALFCPLSVIIG